MRSFSCLALVICLGLSQGILFNGTIFHEEYMCELEGRVLGVCVDPSLCKSDGSGSADCGVEGQWLVCCPSTTLRGPAPARGRKSRQKCKEFSKIDEVSRCPKIRPLISSNEAVVNEYPHVAALGYVLSYGSRELRWLCAGSLISERFVLTEYVCAMGTRSTGRPRRVRLGDVDLGSPHDDAHVQEIAVQKIHRPWKYHSRAFYHNIALLRLVRAVGFTPAVRPACLHTEPVVPAARGIVVGWGRTHNYGGSARSVLRKADLPLVSRRHCNKLYGAEEYASYLVEGILSNSLLCAGEPAGGKDTCMGDGGAPLMVKLARPYCTYSIVGISAFGSIPCGQPLKPSVFTHIYYYIPWIEKIVWPSRE